MNKEQEQLYSEIARNSQIISNVFLGNISVTTIILGFGLENENSLLFLIPFTMLIPSLFFIASQMESTTRIASYLKIFHETKEDGPKWETRWFRIRELEYLPSKRKYALSISGLYGLLGFICILLSFIFWKDYKSISNVSFSSYKDLIIITIPIIVLFLLSISLIVRAFSLNLCREYDNEWGKIKKLEQSAEK